MDKKRYILGIDPGEYKIGIAILDTKNNSITYKNIIKIYNFLDIISTIITEYDISKIIIGKGTGYKKILLLLNSLSFNFKNLTIELINEYKTTIEARNLYINQSPNLLTKIFRFIKSFFIDIDDYSAIVILKKYLTNQQKTKSLNKDLHINKDN